jgi:hydroxymethylpyrimidine pyrophosphatase-like HAD family hydrolase
MTEAALLPTGIRPGGRFDEWRASTVRYAVCDVDGTLIGPHAHATDVVVEAVARAQAAGLRVGYATGRMRDAVAPLHQQLAASGPHVLHNGAEVRADGVTVAAWSLTHAQVDELLVVATERDDLYLEVYADSGFHVSSWDERARPHWGLLGAEPLSVLTSAADLGDGPVPKATFALFDRAVLPWLTDRLAPLGVAIGTAGSPRTPELVYTNVNHPDADKGAALTAAADHLGVPLAEVAAIGDATNDLSMLAVAGTAIAMGQAEPEVVAAAHLVVPEVDADGVATALDALTGWLTPR